MVTRMVGSYDFLTQINSTLVRGELLIRASAGTDLDPYVKGLSEKV